MMNPWHDISAGDNIPDVVTGVIEIPMHSRAKYELDKDSGMLMLDRVLYSAVYYPSNYGFIPRSYCDDGDPLDIIVLSQIEIVPLCLVDAKVIGVMRMLDHGEADDKIIAVAANDMSVNHINDISDLPPHFTLELRAFFEDYKKLEKKEVVIEDFLGKESAVEIIRQSFIDYDNLMAKKKQIKNLKK